MFSSLLSSSRIFRRNSTSMRQARCPRGLGSKRMQLENLESRLLLNVTLEDFNAIKAKYPDLNLTAYGDYNRIEILASNLTDKAIRDAIAAAGESTRPDLIVIRTTAAQNTITLTGGELVIDVGGA